MSFVSVSDACLEQCRAALERTWSGLRVLQFDVHVGPWDPPAGDDFAGRVVVFLTVSGPEDLLVRYGAVTADDLASLPPCGQAVRHGRKIHRGNRRTRVEVCAYDEDSDTRPAAAHPQDGLFGHIAAALVPALWYRTPRRA